MVRMQESTPHAAVRIDQTMTERTIFLAAIEIPDLAERAAYVEQACDGDVNLRTQVEQLLQHHEESSQFLETPAGASSSAVEMTIVSHGSSDDDDDQNTAALSGEEELRKYLQPATRPGWLGRLAHYEIEHILGRGAFGIVVKAFDEKLHRVVAIKLMNPDLASTSPPRKRFLREARTAAAVRNEYIVGIYAVEEEPLPYLVMEYVPGMTLQQRLDQDGPLELSEILRIGQQVASGLAAAHAANLIHRDIKPSNILLEGGIENRAKISDFGLARAVDDASLTSSGLIAGTPMYMAPEQARGDVLDHRADLFSLGSVLYQMASGRPPFRASNTVAVLKRVCDDVPRPIDDVIPGTAGWLCSIIMRLLEKKPADRFQTAKEVADLFARCQAELQLNGKVTCVQSSNLAPRDEPSSTARASDSRPSLDQSASPTARTQPSATGQGSSRRSETATLKLPSILYGIMLGVMMLLPILFGKQLSSYVDAWIWPAIPALPSPADSVGLEFDGKDDFVSIEAVDWSYPQFTIEAFVRSARDSDNGTIVYLGSGGEKLEWMSLYDDHPADPGKRLSGAAIKGKTPFANTSAPFTAGARQHRVLVFDGRYMHYYVNGIWQAKRFAEAHEGLMWKMKNLRIACDGSERRFFQGRIDQVRISRIARYNANFAPVTSLDSDDSTLALYNFNEGTGEVLKDASGNGHDGRIVGAKWVKPAPDTQTSTVPPSPELADSALKFDGQIETQVDIPSIEIVEGQPITLEGFFTPQGLCYNREGYQQFMGTSYHSLHVPPQGDGSWRWVWTFGRERNDAGLRWCDGPRCMEQSRVHIACIHDNGELRIYFDGTRVCATRDSINPLTKNDKSSDFKIGAGFMGRIDEVRVSRIARYQDDFIPQIRFDVDDNTIALYHFDEGTGDILKDASGNGHDGKIVGATWVNSKSGDLISKPNSPSSEISNLKSQLSNSSTGWHGWPTDAPAPAIAPFSTEQAKQHQEAWAKYLNIPVEYTNSIGMKFRLIPPGEFTMGSSPEEIAAALKDVKSNDKHWQECIQSEAPQHKVILTQPFYLGVNEVTQAEYEQVIGTNPSYFAAMGMGKDAVAGLVTANHPVETVSWNDAAEFCEKLSNQEQLKPFYFRADETITPLDGTGYRLPSEAEWEFACRAGTTTKFWISDKDQDLVLAGWFGRNAKSRTHAVGDLKANPLGLHDMHGNVWEWVQDAWDKTCYGQFQDKAAINPSYLRSADPQHLLRGGDWFNASFHCRSSHRNSFDTTGRGRSFGLRVSLTIDAVKATTVKRESKPAGTAWQGWPADAPAAAIAPFNAEQAKQHQEAWAKYLNVPVEYTNSMGMKFRLIPPGEFMMGSSPEEIAQALGSAGDDKLWQETINSEGPRHKVILTKATYVGAHEVTQGQFEQVMGRNPSRFGPMGASKDAIADLDTTSFPVEKVSWDEATRFCVQLGKVQELADDNAYRLMTDAEWEFSCRAGTTTEFWIGENHNERLQTAWIYENSAERTHAVGELKENPFGLYDVHGNVWEWVQDGWDPTFYGQLEGQLAVDPIKPSIAGAPHVTRGGCWSSSVASCRSATRCPETAAYSGTLIGFRVSLGVDAVRTSLKPTDPAISK